MPRCRHLSIGTPRLHSLSGVTVGGSVRSCVEVLGLNSAWQRSGLRATGGAAQTEATPPQTCEQPGSRTTARAAAGNLAKRMHTYAHLTSTSATRQKKGVTRSADPPDALGDQLGGLSPRISNLTTRFAQGELMSAVRAWPSPRKVPAMLKTAVNVERTVKADNRARNSTIPQHIGWNFLHGRHSHTHQYV